MESDWKRYFGLNGEGEISIWSSHRRKVGPTPSIILSQVPQLLSKVSGSEQRVVLDQNRSSEANLALKTNEDNLKSKASTSQQHDYKKAELSRSKDFKNPELRGDVEKHLKTHNDCLNIAAEILHEEIKPPIQVVKIGLTKDMIIPEDSGEQPEISKIEIPNFYANKRIIDISTIIQELANDYLNDNAIWSYYSRDQLMIYANSRELRRSDMDGVKKWILSLLKPEEKPITRALKAEFISSKLLTRYCKLIGHK
ncbi:hypothetical protein H5410_026634 [Solanum commersonii]|uniref:Uncharacterized protein n=1 Tax=Solanum commersonii TaxID=4109 RepID=A0A9J5Z227_SOLCO|nr:hypothetical protein H5410_026634 [Solanum commersonii]